MAINKFMLAALKAISYADIDVKKNYKLERALTKLAHPPVILPYKISEHRIERDGYDIPVRVFTPGKIQINDIILFFHGGGWVNGGIDTYTNICKVMSEKTGARVMSVDYRLAPEHPFPCGPEDCYAAAKEVICGDFSEQFPDMGRVILAGDSAGGNLAAVVSIMARDRGEFHIDRQILFYPAVYYEHTDESPFDSVRENGRDYLLTSKKICDYMDLYLPDKSKRKNPYFAPLTEEDLTDQPKTLIITAEFDPLRDEGEAYAEKLRENGCDVTLCRMTNALHGFLSLPSRFVHIKKSYDIINRFLKEDDSYAK